MSDPRNRAALWLNDPSFVHGGDPVDELASWMEKAAKYDQLHHILKELVFKFREDKSLGSYEIHLYELIESIINGGVRTK